MLNPIKILYRNILHKAVKNELAAIRLAEAIETAKAKPKRKRRGGGLNGRKLEDSVSSVLESDLVGMAYQVVYTRVVPFHPHTTQQSVNSALAKLAREGKAVKVKRGVYRRAA